MAIDVSITAATLAQVAGALQQLGQTEVQKALARALNATGFEVRKIMQAELEKRFDRVSPWIKKSPKVFPAAPDRLAVAVAPTITTNYGQFMRGGKVGVDPQDVLQAQEKGGQRKNKKSENALLRAGILPSGFQTALPKDPYPGSDDGRGNFRGAFMQRLLSYMQAYSEVGYQQNMTRASRDKMQKKGVTKRGYKKTGGVRFFVAYGRMRGGSAKHLQPGIWAARGIHDSDIRPVVIFTRRASYRPRLDLDAVAKAADLQELLDRKVRWAIRQAAEDAAKKAGASA